MNSIENQPYQPSVPVPAAAGEPFSWGGLIGAVLVFLIILVAALWMIKRLNNISYRNMEVPWARVLDRQVLNNHQALYLVEIAGKLQVLGGTDHHLTKIEEINDPELVAEIFEEIAKRPQGNVNHLIERMGKRLGGRKKNKEFSSQLEHWLEEVNK
ncbi:MAG: FliO/MopB family protein [Bacillota bacterium]|jgi:flagellar protein FliO/FliZ|nr:FliO/MopB family protein [Clostridia bacterium]